MGMAALCAVQGCWRMAANVVLHGYACVLRGHAVPLLWNTKRAVIFPGRVQVGR